ILIALVGYGATLCVGFTAGFSGVLLQQLQNNSSDLQTDENMASWIVSVYTGATSIGCFLCGFVLNVTGRRTTALIGVDHWMDLHRTLKISCRDAHRKSHRRFRERQHRSLGHEMADPRMRISLITGFLLTFSIGVVIITALGATLQWRTAAGICAALSFLVTIGYYLVPESPVWLIKIGKVQRASQVLKWLWSNRHDEKAEEDLQEILNRLQEETREQQAASWKSKLRACLKAQYMKPFLIMHAINLLLILSGPHIIIFYASEILSKLDRTGDIDLNFMLIFSSSARVAAMAITCFLVLWFRRRPVCITSGVVSGLATLCIAVTTSINIFHSWSLFVLLIIYIIFSTFGLFTVVPILSSELMPSKIRSVACAYIFTVDDVGMFIFTKAFHSIVNGVGIHALFWILAISCLVCSCFLYLLLPETKDRTLVQIEKYFSQKNILWITRPKNQKAVEIALVALMAHGALFCIGLTGGYSGILLPQLQSNSSDFQIDDNAASEHLHRGHVRWVLLERRHHVLHRKAYHVADGNRFLDDWVDPYRLVKFPTYPPGRNGRSTSQSVPRLCLPFDVFDRSSRHHGLRNHGGLEDFRRRKCGAFFSRLRRLLLCSGESGLACKKWENSKGQRCLQMALEWTARREDLNFALVFASATRVVAMVFTCFLLLWFGRRPLCVFSGAGAGLATLLIAVVTTLNFYHAWLLFVLLSIYVALSTCGLFTVVPILSSEMIPSRIRGIAGGYIFTMDDIGLFIFTKAFPYILKDIGISGLFWIFSCSCFAFSLFLYLFMPETKNCTLVEIEKYFAQKNILWIHRKRTDSNNMIIDPAENLALNDRNDEETPGNPQQKRRNRPLYGQVLVALMAHGATFSIGLTGGFSGILLHQLKGNCSELHTDDNAASWIGKTDSLSFLEALSERYPRLILIKRHRLSVSVYTGSTTLGCLLSGIIMFYAGRCSTALMGDLSLTLGWIFVALSSSHPLMLIGRALNGFGRGVAVLAIVIHQDEMADPRLRASLISVCLLTYSVGVSVITALGTTVGWRIAAGISAGLSFLDFVGYCFIPESPVWLVRNGKIQKARDVFKWLWNGQHDDKAEEDLQEQLSRLKDETKERRLSSWKDCFQAQYMKPFIIVHIANLILIFCGMYLAIFYASDFMSAINKTGDLDLSFMLVFTSAVRVVAMIFTCFLLYWCGRRPLCIFSGLVAGLATLGVATAMSLHFFHPWFLFILFLIYVAFSTCGLFTVLPLLTTEMMPSRIRSVACGYIYTTDDIGLFIFTKVFPFVVRDIGMEGLFWIFSSSCLALSFFMYLFLPETKERTLVEIEKYFSQKNLLWIKRDIE
ncbi:hypothetical protein C0J52_00755, partial [Blattella germanica]